MFPLTTVLAVSVILPLIFWLTRRGFAAASKCCPLFVKQRLPI
jgi:hypothetical protein